MAVLDSSDYYLVATVFTTVGSVWTLAWFLQSKFSALSSKLYDKIERSMQQILDKLEYHEKYDDQRFMAISNDLWDIRVRNAARDGLPLETRADSKERVR